MASKFQKRHYEVIAEAMQASRFHDEKGMAAQWNACVEQLANRLARDNSDFKRARFIAACEPGANVRARA